MILESIASVLGGGVTGVVGAMASHVADFFKQKEANKHEREMAELSLKERAMEFEQQAKIATVEAEKVTTLAAENSFQASFAADKASYGIWFVDLIRGLIRPGLTIYLIVLTNLIVAKIAFLESVMASLEQAQAFGLISDIINSILYLTTTAVLWWFGSRSKSFKN